MKISNGTVFELIISLFLIYSVIFVDNNMTWNVVAGSVGIITFIHCFYLLLKARKINKSRRGNNFLENNNWKEFSENNFQSEGNKSSFKDMRLQESDTDSKNINYHNMDINITNQNVVKSKHQKILIIILSLSIFLNIILIPYIFILSNQKEQLKQKQECYKLDFDYAEKKCTNYMFNEYGENECLMNFSELKNIYKEQIKKCK